MNGESPTTETKSGDITGKLVDAVKANDDPMSQKHPEAPAGLVFFSYPVILILIIVGVSLVALFWNR